MTKNVIIYKNKLKLKITSLKAREELVLLIKDDYDNGKN